MPIISQAKKLLSEYDSQTTVGKFAQSVLDHFEDQLEVSDNTEVPFIFTKISKNEGATETDFKYQGTFNHKPAVGQSFQFFYDDHVITTSTVKEVTQLVNDEIEIKTLNSVYVLGLS